MIRSGHVVMLCALVLLTMGVVMVQSAGMQVRPLDTGMDPTQAAAEAAVTSESLFTSRTSSYLLLAVAAMAVAAFFPVRKVADRLDRVVWFRPGGDLGVLIIGSVALIGLLSLVYVPFLSRVKNGSGRWINLHLPGLESVQPSEIVKWSIILLIAWYAARLASYRENKVKNFFSGLLPVVFCAGAISAVVVLEDLGTGALMMLVVGVILLAAGARWWHFGLFIPPAIAGVVFAILAAPYRVRRITAFVDPYADPSGDGYHLIQSIATVAGGGVFGRGLGNGLQKFGYLPEDTTDFLFAIVCEELGLIGVLIVVCSYAALVWSGTSIAMREKSSMLRLIVLGVISTVVLQAMINLVVVTGLGPTKGIALPLMSSGGTGWIMTAFSLGLIVSIERTQSLSSQFLAAPDSAEDEVFALRARRSSEVELKPSFADRAGLWSTSVLHSVSSPKPLAPIGHSGNAQVPYAAHASMNQRPVSIQSIDMDRPIADDEMEELMGETDSSHMVQTKPSILNRFKFTSSRASSHTRSSDGSPTQHEHQDEDDTPGDDRADLFS